ncbi:hypothetical protein GGS23DRAFT_101653 [Durotheca rogersii]|uniref:uncharacterized protein n=1 Tax=Durotheca rogersii TaxID=419775 RepID=UPI00221EBDC8|nr:uncharacterized protein GGS23DRAFT_101653 [Durotheca rogersii]KAI5862463.1 hypothetical protein GGS23DRAFT_101653 [Durotheca rogersii]
MWLLRLAALLCLSALALGQLPNPGEPALKYSDGAFIEPKGSQSSYPMGATMNVSWTTTYETSNLWLIVAWEFNQPVLLASNIGQTWYAWEVSTDSTNATQIYSFRVVDAQGTEAQQKGGGFLSASFFISGLRATSSSTTSTSTSSASSSTFTTSITSTSSAGAFDATLPTTSVEVTPSGLTDSAKIGVGVGVGVGGVGLIALILGVIFFRRSRNKKTREADSMEPYSQPYSQPGQSFASTPQTYVGSPVPGPYPEYYKPAEMEAANRGAELDAGQGHGFRPEIATSNTQRSQAAELQG